MSLSLRRPTVASVPSTPQLPAPVPVVNDDGTVTKES
jgi:hypothetical protein